METTVMEIPFLLWSVAASPLLIALTFFVVGFSLLCVYYSRHAIGTVKPIGSKTPSAVGGIPILAHSLEAVKAMANNAFDEWLYKNTLIYGQKTWTFSLAFQKTFYVTHNPSNIEYMLKTNFDNFPKGDGYIERLFPLLGDGIFNADGDLWYMQRKVASKIFNERKFRDNVEVVFAQQMEKMLKILIKHAENSLPLDLHDLLHKYTLESFGHIGFGVGFGCLNEGPQPAFALAFDRAQEIAGQRFWLPLYSLSEYLTGTGKEMYGHLDTVYTYALKMLDDKIASSSSEPSNDLLSLFIESVSSKDQEFDGMGKHNASTLRSKETRHMLAQIIINLIIAGRDTTAQAMSWAFYHMTKNPSVTEKILQEVTQVLGPEADPSAPVSYEQVKQLSYTKAVFLESLRLQPSVPREGKLALKDCTLPDGTKIPAGAVTLFSIYCMGRMEALWGPDATAFRPERWIEMENLPSPYKYPVFNAGPRLCLGKTMAETEAVFVLAEVTRRLKISFLDNQIISRKLSLTNPAKYGMKVMVQMR